MPARKPPRITMILKSILVLPGPGVAFAMANNSWYFTSDARSILCTQSRRLPYSLFVDPLELINEFLSELCACQITLFRSRVVPYDLKMYGRAAKGSHAQIPSGENHMTSLVPELLEGQVADERRAEYGRQGHLFRTVSVT